MTVNLRKIKRDKFKEVIDTVITSFKTTKKVIIDDNYLNSNSEDIIVDGRPVTVNLDIDEYKIIVGRDDYTYNKLAELGMKLHKEMKDIEGKKIPKFYLYEKELWAYLSLSVFKDVVKQLRLDDDDKVNEEKIRQFYFNTGSLSRTGLMFVWAMIDRLTSENNYELSQTAFEFVDPVKAILERTMSRNSNILKAFVQGIINNGRDPKFKRDGYRLKIPNNISCFAAVNFLDDYPYEELVKIITAEQAKLLK